MNKTQPRAHESYRGSRRNAVRACFAPRQLWRKGPFHDVAMNPMKQRRRTIVHDTLLETRA